MPLGKEALRIIGGQAATSLPTDQYPKKPTSTTAVHPTQLAKTLSAAQARLRKIGRHPQLSQRGISLEDALANGLGAWHNGLLIGIYDYQGRLVNLKVRRTFPYQGMRYYHPFAGLPQVAWHSHNCQHSLHILVVEGELNALVFHLTTGLATIGVPGAESSPPGARHLKDGPRMHAPIQSRHMSCHRWGSMHVNYMYKDGYRSCAGMRSG